METREEKIAYIKRRMKELGLNQRSLAMKATGKPDTVRNLLRGVSKNWRQDNYEAVMRVLEEEEHIIQKPSALTPIEAALIAAMQGIMITIASKPIVKKRDFERVFIDLRQFFQRENQPGAIGVMNQFLDSLDHRPHQETAQIIHRLLSPSQPV